MPIVGVIYSISQGRVRRLVVPDDDAQLSDFSSWLLPGEAALTYDRSLGTDGKTAQEQVDAVTGLKSPKDDICAVIDKDGMALYIVKADPIIDTHPEGTIVPSYEGVEIGCVFDNTSKLFIRQESKIPAGTRLKDGSILQTDIVIPGGVVVKK